MKKNKLIIFLLCGAISFSLVEWVQSNQWRKYHIVYDNFHFVQIEKMRSLSQNDVFKSLMVSSDFNESMHLYMKGMQRILSTNIPPCQYFLVGTHTLDKKKMVFGLVVEDGEFKGYFLSHADSNNPNKNLTRYIFLNNDKKLSHEILQHILKSREQYFSAYGNAKGSLIPEREARVK